MTSQLAEQPASRPRRTAADAEPASADGSALRQVLCATRAMQRSDDLEHILEILVSTVHQVAPSAGVWAIRQAPGRPASTASAFDPTSGFGAACAQVDLAAPTLLEALGDRISEARPAFALDVSEVAPGTPLAAWGPLTVTVFPLSSTGVAGALVTAVPDGEPSARDKSLITLLCDTAGATLELADARDSAEHTEALFETFTQLTASYTDPELVLQRVVRSTCDLLHTDAAWVMLLDEARQLLTIRTASGITGRSFFEATCGIDELLPGVAIRKRRAVCARDLHGDQRAKYSTREGLRSILCAPMFAEDNVLGVLVAAHREVFDPSPEDMRIMSALASAAAVSISNARLYAEREESIRQLGDVNRLLNERTEALEENGRFQKRLTELVLAGGGLEELTRTMSEALECAVLVLDRDLLALHLSGGESHLDSVRRAIASSIEDEEGPTGVLRIDLGEEGETPHALVAPLDLAGERTAFVAVIELGAALDETRLGMMESAVTAVGLELMRDRATAEAEARLTGGLFQTILAPDGVDEATVVRRASYLGYELGGSNAVIAVAAGEEKGTKQPGQVALQGAIQRALRRHRDVAIAVFERDDVVYVLVSDPKEVTPERMKEELRLIKHALELSGRAAGSRLGYAGPYAGIEGIRQAVTEAGYALHVQRVLGTTGAPVAFGELGVWALLGRIGSREHLADFSQSVLGTLIAHDAERQSQLVDTVRTLIRCNFHYRSAAEELYAHPNTIRYRMTRVTELTGLDLADGDDRLKIEIALRILDVLGSPGSSVAAV